MTTVMGICAEKGGFKMPNSKAKISKVMSTEPRRIKEIHIELNFEKNSLTDVQKKKLENVGRNCPVAKSLNSEIKQDIINTVVKEIGPHAKPEKIDFTSALPKTRSGKIMRRILRKIAEGDLENFGDISTLSDSSVVEKLKKIT